MDFGRIIGKVFYRQQLRSARKICQTLFAKWKQNARVDRWTFDGFGDEWYYFAFRTVSYSSGVDDLDSRERLFPWLNSAQFVGRSGLQLNVYPIPYYDGTSESKRQSPIKPNPDFGLPYAQTLLRKFLSRNDPNRGSVRHTMNYPEEAFRNLDRQTFIAHVTEILPDGTLEDGPLLSWHRPRFSDEADLDEFFAEQIGLQRENAPAHQYRDLLMNRMFPHENTIFFGAGLGDGQERVLLIFDEYFIEVIIGSKYTTISNT